MESMERVDVQSWGYGGELQSRGTESGYRVEVQSRGTDRVELQSRIAESRYRVGV